MVKQDAQQIEGTKGLVTHFQIGPDAENDVVCVEDLLMQLALAEVVIVDMAEYISAVENNGGSLPDNKDVFAPDTWAISGMQANLFKIAHALKCGCFGHESGYLR